VEPLPVVAAPLLGDPVELAVTVPLELVAVLPLDEPLVPLALVAAAVVAELLPAPPVDVPGGRVDDAHPVSAPRRIVDANIQLRIAAPRRTARSVAFLSPKSQSCLADYMPPGIYRDSWLNLERP
jgi:hypothetical protein